MRAILLALALAACTPAPATTTEPQPVPASGTWTAPDGSFSVLVPAGWAEVEDAGATADTLLTIGSPTMREAQRLRQCSIERQSMSGHGVSQAQINSGAANVTAERVARGTVLAFSNSVVDGVRVVSFDQDLGGMRHMQKVFPIARGDGFTQYTVACGATGDENFEADLAAMTSFMASLTFNRQGER